jgi:hypothetical protein
MISIGTVNRRTLVMGGAGLLVAAAAAGWFFFGEELLSPQEPSPPSGAKAPAKPAAKAPGAKPAAEAAAKPAAKPIPDKPDDAVAEVIALAGLAGYGEEVRETALQGMDAAPDRPANLTPAAAQAYRDAIGRVLAPERTNERLRAQLRQRYELGGYTRFIEQLREPINEKMVKLESEKALPEQTKQFFESLRTKPLTAERQELIRRVDAASHASELIAESMVLVIRGLIDGGVVAPSAGGAPTKPEQTLAALRKGAETQARALLAYTYRGASDAELRQYAGLLEGEPGRWGMTMLTASVKAALDSAAKELGIEMGRVAAEQREAAKTQVAAAQEKAPAAEARAEAAKAEAAKAEAAKVEASKTEAVKPEAVKREAEPAQERPKAERAAAAPTPRLAPDPAKIAAAEERRRASLPPVYSRYNDLITAVTLQDHAAARELLADGKSPNARASNGLTALMIAVELRDLEMVNLLLEKGANPNLRASGNRTAMRLAKEANSPDLQSLLTSHGAKE